MKVVEVKRWVAKETDESGKPKETKEDTLMALTMLINQKGPATMPRGLDAFRIMNRLSKAFDAAEQTDKLVLSDSDYTFMKDMVVNDLPSNWGRNPQIVDAIEAFLAPKEE